ncbi:hypothetical protein Tco_1017495 [Tanacetum coccineum]|uniref:Uncharacterized protein n=1 Tax=Tanacetum coccineum TaxID=301880 RepID=A0ABQ5FSW6_9ASTR
MMSDFDSHKEKWLSSLRTQLQQQQDDMSNKLNTLWKICSEKFNIDLARGHNTNNATHVNDEIRDEEVRKNDEVGKEREWLDIEEPLDLVDTCEESVYESLIKEIPRFLLNYDLRIEKGDPRNLKIPCIIGHKFIANAYIDGAKFCWDRKRHARIHGKLKLCGRKAHLLGDNQILSVVVFDEHLEDIWRKNTSLGLNFGRNQSRWQMGMKTQLMIEDQRVETTSGFIVTPSEALIDAVWIYCDSVLISREI